MDWAGWLRPLWDILLSWFRVFTGPRPPSAASGGGVVANRDVKIKKIKNVNMQIETECNGPSGKENDAGQGPSANNTASDAGVISKDRISADEIDGDLNMSITTKKGN